LFSKNTTSGRKGKLNVRNNKKKNGIKKKYCAHVCSTFEIIVPLSWKTENNDRNKEWLPHEKRLNQSVKTRNGNTRGHPA